MSAKRGPSRKFVPVPEWVWKWACEFYNTPNPTEQLSKLLAEAASDISKQDPN